jgi:hypothetical protein
VREPLDGGFADTEPERDFLLRSVGGEKGIENALAQVKR